MQLHLAFLDIPKPSATVWEQLDEEQRVAALELLARLIAQAVHNAPSAEGSEND